MATDPLVFAILPEARRNWAVASIFGQVDKLTALHAALAQRIAPQDNLITLATSSVAAQSLLRSRNCCCFGGR